jgi:hypothetical protein
LHCFFWQLFLVLPVYMLERKAFHPARPHWMRFTSVSSSWDSPTTRRRLGYGQLVVIAQLVSGILLLAALFPIHISRISTFKNP